MSNDKQSRRIVLEPDNPHRLANLSGRLNEHLRLIENRLDIKIQNRGNVFLLSGEKRNISQGEKILQSAYQQTSGNPLLTPDAIHMTIQEKLNDSQNENNDDGGNDLNENMFLLRTPKCSVKPRGKHQKSYVHSIVKHDINFGIGPAGTGKTYLAVACAVEALIKEEISRILLVRPAVEAGEKLGFLPGDLSQKVDPYLRPLYDALYEMLGFEKVGKLIERNIIEVAPLAYMRGRTLNNSFIILDESQNTTASQMKMFLTRIGFGSTAVITGDVTQIDLPKGVRSGLVHVSGILEDVDGVSFTYFDSADVVRHPIVQRVVDAYDKHDKQSIATLNNQEKELKGTTD